MVIEADAEGSMTSIVLYKDGNSILEKSWPGHPSDLHELVVECMLAHGADRAELIDPVTGDLKFSHPKEPTFAQTLHSTVAADRARAGCKLGE